MAPSIEAQIPNRRPSGPPPDAGGNAADFNERQQEQDIEPPDTSKIYYFFVDAPQRIFPFADSTLADFQQYDPARRRTLDYATLGQLGSAHQPLVFEAADRRGFDLGQHQFDLYHTTGNELPYYKLERPYTDLSYYQQGEQADSYFKAKFSRNFADGINYTLDYQRLSMIGRLNQYPNQNTRNTALTTGLWYHSANERYDGFLSFAANTIEQEDNGGLEQEPAVEGAFDSPSSAEVFLANGQTRHAHRELMYTHYYRFGGQVDTLGNYRRAFTLSHQARLNSSAYKFFDASPPADSSYYGIFEVDPRGIRHFVDHDLIENSFRISTYKLGRQKGGAPPESPRDLFEAGLTHTFHSINQEPRDTVIQNLFLTGRWQFNPGRALDLDVSGHFGLLDNAGDYRISGHLVLNFGNFGQLEGRLINQLYSPTLQDHRLFIAQKKVWDNDFEKTLSTTVEAAYAVPKLGFKATGAYHLLNNFIYRDTLGAPRQSGAPVSILQLIIEQNLRVWKIHLDNVVALQQSTEDFVRLPGIFGKHSLYYQGFWFRVLNVRLGLDLRYNTDYFSDYYLPVTGAFILQNKREVDFYPAADAFLSMRVTRFRAYLKYENLTDLLYSDNRFFYQTAFYPFPEGRLIFGIRWRLTD